MQETWKPVVGFEGLYEVSDQGRVKSLQRTVNGPHGSKHTLPERVLAGGQTETGYWHVLLYREGVRRTRVVHVLVAEAFLGPRVGDSINHIDGNKDNNAAGNLEYCSHGDNNRHALRTGLRVNAKGSRHGHAKLNEEQVSQIRQLVASGRLQKHVARMFQVSKQTICKIVKRQKWQHV